MTPGHAGCARPSGRMFPELEKVQLPQIKHPPADCSIAQLLFPKESRLCQKSRGPPVWPYRDWKPRRRWLRVQVRKRGVQDSAQFLAVAQKADPGRTGRAG